MEVDALPNPPSARLIGLGKEMILSMALIPFFRPSFIYKCGTETQIGIVWMLFHFPRLGCVVN